MPDSDTRGRFVWYDLMTSDPSAAADFYRDVVGWGTQAWDDPEVPYTMWTTDGAPMGGVVGLPAEMGAPPHWLAYVSTPDVDETARRADELGGAVLHGPEDIPEVGRFAVIADPQGAMFAAFTPHQDADAGAGEGEGEDEPSVGRFSWHELATTDHRAGFEFYEALFGWERTDDFEMGEMGTYQMYGVGGRTMGGMFDAPGEETPAAPAWLLYARVMDLDTAAERVAAKGGRVEVGPMDVPGGGRIAQCVDPQGAAFALHQTAE